VSALSAVLDRLPPAAKIALHARLLAAKRQREAGRRQELLYPETGPLSRHAYPKSMQFFEAGSTFTERAILGGNRTSKSTTMCFELVCHLIGRYPHWWKGRRFDRAISAWCASVDAKSLREGVQQTLFGPPGAMGDGLIPAAAIVNTTTRQGVSGSIDTALIKHQNGAISRLSLKSYDSRRPSFQAAKLDVVALDEEPPSDIYSECLMRLMSTEPGQRNGAMMLACTPLMGLTETILRFLPGGKIKEDHTRFAILISWNDAPHLSATEKAELEEALLPSEREARKLGIPSIGRGAVFPVPQSIYTCDPFVVPAWMRRCAGMDVGWNMTTVLWGAFDFENDVLYITGEYYGQQAEAAIHAAAIKARGDWVPIAIDPASRGRSQHDGQQLLEIYQRMGLKVLTADNAVEAGIAKVLDRLSTGRLRVFSTCPNLLAELPIYRRGEDGKPVKQNDHGCDALRYLVASGIDRAVATPSHLWGAHNMPRGLQHSSGHESSYDPLSYGVSEQTYGDRLRDRYQR
jgi:phage terminase large subunit-like protein